MLIRRIVIGLSVAAAALVGAVPAAQAEASTAVSGREMMARLLAEYGKDVRPAPAEVTAAFARSVGYTGDVTPQACTSPLVFRNKHANLLVAAEVNYAGTKEGMLRARTSPSATDLRWERFMLCYSDDVVYIKALGNDKWVAAEIGGGPGFTGPNRNMLRARTGFLGPERRYETFKIFNHSDGSYLFYSVAANRYVAAELGGGDYTGPNRNMLRARTLTSATDLRWERFEIRPA